VIAAVVIAALACMALVYISVPLRRGPEQVLEPEMSPAVETATEQKRAALTGIIDLEEELAAGKLAPADFSTLRDMYEREALDALRRLDDLQTHTDLNDDLEREIAAARADLSCPSCGALKEASASICSRCGASL
jgi:hypothetical protein